eukprot:5595872-Pleurochrysis_carterae.AAC.2
MKDSNTKLYLPSIIDVPCFSHYELMQFGAQNSNDGLRRAVEPAASGSLFVWHRSYLYYVQPLQVRLFVLRLVTAAAVTSSAAFRRITPATNRDARPQRRLWQSWPELLPSTRRASQARCSPGAAQTPRALGGRGGGTRPTRGPRRAARAPVRPPRRVRARARARACVRASVRTRREPACAGACVCSLVCPCERAMLSVHGHRASVHSLRADEAKVSESACERMLPMRV